jgi:hypothetical protein
VGETFTDNPDKCVVREQWNTPLLRHLHKEYGVRYRYLGLPGPELLDVSLWNDMIDEVIAFEPPDRDGSGRVAFNLLTYNMRKAGIRGRVYCGSFEEVVLLRKDFEGQDYAQDSVITLYNLDFCNEICSRVRTQSGERLLRFEAIRHILQDQAECYQRVRAPRHFILMLTVRNQIAAGRIREYLSPTKLDGDSRAYYQRCAAINGIPEDRRQLLIGSHSWAIKTLLHTMLRQYFGNPNLSALFFPQVFYLGTRVRSGDDFIESPMLHWLVFCRFGEDDAPTPEFWPGGYLSKPSVTVKGRRSLMWQAQTGEDRPGGTSPSSVQWLTQHGGNILGGLRRRE